MSAKNSRTLSNYVNNCVLDSKVLGEIPSKCASLFWAFLCCFLLNCFWLPAKLLERMKNNMKDEDNKRVPMIFPASDSDVYAEKQSPPEFSFSFSRRNSCGNIVTEVNNCALPTATFTTNSNRYQFMSGKDVCGFMEEPETMGFVVQEIFLNSTDNLEISSPNMKDFNDEFHSSEESSDDISETLELKKDILAENKNFTVQVQEEMSDDGENYLLLENDVKFVPRNRKDISFSTLDLKLDQENEYYYYLASFDETRPEFSPISELCIEPIIIHDRENTEIIQRNSTTFGDSKTLEYFDDYIPYSPDSIDANEGFKGVKLEHGEIEKVSVENQTLESDAATANNAEDDEFDILLEHQNLVKQMKKEVKAGLPTISEEGEGECAILKPLKLEDKFEYKDRLREIRKFYKTYAQKMRKLDILNYQSLQAISFLQLKDSDKFFMASKKATVPFVKHFPLPNFILFKERRVYADPTLKSIKDLHRDLEVVYVGQVCLSWEILRWQYGKVIELLQLEHDDDSQGPRHQYSYNQLACEFQQFQVLLQRFVEDEPFRSPRIHNYVESRRSCRALLHVPMIKDDRSREKKDKSEEQQDSISVAKLVEIVKESMQAFWEFVRADKDENHTVSKGCLAYLQVLNDDPELVINIKASLEKKERKLKMIDKAGNCIVKMFQKVPDDKQSCEMIMAKVDLKLVSRVLSLSRWTTDQLRWCERKLNCINIGHRRIYTEPSFSLFPC